MDNELRTMISTFRVVELKRLLDYLSESKAGLKSHLHARVLTRLTATAPTPDIIAKIRELYAQRLPRLNIAPIPAPSTSLSVVPIQHSSVPQRSAMLFQAPTLRVNPRNVGPFSAAPGNPWFHGPLPPLPSPIPRYSASLPTPLQTIQRALVLSAPGAMDTDENQSDPVPLRNPNEAVCTRLNIRFKPLLFYDILAVVLPETNLTPADDALFQMNTVNYMLLPEQVQLIVSSKQNNEYKVQLQLRFAVVDENGRQDDILPPQCLIYTQKLDSIPVPEDPVKKTKYPPCHQVDVTGYCELSVGNSSLCVYWRQNGTRVVHSMSLHLVRKLNSETLLQRLRACGIRKCKVTWAIIENQLRQDTDIEAMSLVGSLICPIGKVRMATPCRSSKCSHFQCFDATFFVQMNEKKERLVCPICDQLIAFEDLLIDGLFLRIVAAESSYCTEVQFYENRTWSGIEKKENRPPNSIKRETGQERKSAVELVDLDCTVEL